MAFDYEDIWKTKWGDMQKYGPCHRHHRRVVRKMLQGLQFGSVLDIGCGEGSNLLFFKSNWPGVELAGADVSAAALELTRKVVPEARLYGFDSQKEKLDRQFDLVFCSDVLEHIPEDEAVIKNLYAMTGKYCLVATMQGRMRDFEKTIGHVRNYKYGELAEKMRAAGFKNLRIVEWGWPLYSPLYRNLHNSGGIHKLSEGKMGFIKRLASVILYYIFFLNSSRHGDIIYILGER